MVMDHHVTKQTLRTTCRKSKQGNDHQLTQNKKNRPPLRGPGMEQLERQRLQEERRQKMTEEIPSLHPLQNGVVHHHHHHHHQLSLPSPAAAPAPAPQMMFPGPNLFMDIHPNYAPGYRFDNQMFEVPNYVKCGASDACGSCFKKKRINSGSNNNLNTPNQFRYNNNVIEKLDYSSAKNLCFSPQVREAMSGYRVRTGGNGIPEYEFFPGKGGETTSSWCVSGSGGGGTERGGMIGLHGGDGSSCVTAVTSSNNEEGSVCCSIDLSLKL